VLARAATPSSPAKRRARPCSTGAGCVVPVALTKNVGTGHCVAHSALVATVAVTGGREVRARVRAKAPSDTDVGRTVPTITSGASLGVSLFLSSSTMGQTLVYRRGSRRPTTLTRAKALLNLPLQPPQQLLATAQLRTEVPGGTGLWMWVTGAVPAAQTF
jgi:hypothetical protein